MQKQLKIYIINLKRHSIRRKNISAELESVGFYNYEFIEAVDGTEIKNTRSLLDSGELNHKWIGPNGKLTTSMIACAASHKKACEKFLKDGDETALIIEDDIKFTKYGIKMILTGNINLYTVPLDQKFEWDVFVWGGASNNLAFRDIGLVGIGEYKRYLPEWAASSYQITRKGAQKLIENNTPLKHSADINLECADTNMYCLNHSLVVQSYPNFERPHAETIHSEVASYLSSKDDFEEYIPATGMTPNYLENLEEARETQDPNVHYYKKIRECCISGDIDVKSVEWGPYTNAKGDTLEYWTHIHLK